MRSEKLWIYISATIISITVIILSLLLNDFSRATIQIDTLRYALIVLISTAIFLFLSTSIIEHYKEKEQEIKRVIDETLHELNTPIATIKANVALLKKRIDDSSELKRLYRIEEASAKLYKLYESIENSLKEQIDIYQKERFSIKSALSEVVKRFDDIKKGIEITMDIDDTAIHTSKEHFERAIENLISNAIKYNQENGKVEIAFKANTLSIKDSGRGIDTKNLFIIFEKAYQENPTTKGFGMGLSIVKNYCDKEGIEIKIDTQKGVGTTFLLDLTPLVLK